MEDVGNMRLLNVLLLAIGVETHLQIIFLDQILEKKMQLMVGILLLD